MSVLSKKLKKEFQTKLSKLLWARSKSSPIGLRHDKCDKRISVRYDDFVRLHDTYGEPFLTHTEHPGIIVIAPPEVILTPRTPADVWLRDHLGPDHDIACVIGVEGKGTFVENKKLETFRTIAAENKWEVLKTVSTGTRGNGYGNCGKWSGHYFVALQGSGTTSIEEGCVSLTNDAIEYASEADQERIKHQLLYMMLQVPDFEKLFDSVPTQDELNALHEYCQANNLLDWDKFPVSPIGKDGKLRCWSERPLTAENFLVDQYDQTYAQKCHVDSVATAQLDFDVTTRRLKTSVRPYGFMWGIMRFNMLQGKGSIAGARDLLGLELIADLQRRLAKYESV
jgi:hypothetical protein